MQEREDIMLQIVNELPNFTEAIRYCIRMAGLKDKQVYLELHLESSQWARIMNGSAHFPHERLVDLMNICRNHIPLEWLAKQCGYDLRLTQSSYEERLEEKQKENDELRLQLNQIVAFLKEAKIS